MRSILRFVFVVFPTAALATAVVVGVSNGRSRQASTADGDLQRDLQLASTATIELAPLGEPLATVSAIEAPPSRTPARSVRPKRSKSGSRVVRSRTPTVAAASEAQVAEAVEADESDVSPDLEEALADAAIDASASGGVALPRPTAIPVAFPTGGADEGTYDPGPGTVIRGGGIDPDHCQIYGRRGGRVYGPPIYRQPRGPSIADRIRRSQPSQPTTSDRPRRGSLGDRVRQASNSGSRSSGGSVRSSSSNSGGRSSLGSRIRSSRGR